MAECWPYIGEGALRCSLSLVPNILADSPMYASSSYILLWAGTRLCYNNKGIHFHKDEQSHP